MKNTYFEGMLKDLVERSGHPAVNKVEHFAGFEPTDMQSGLVFEFTDGAAMFVKVVSTSPPAGGHSGGPDEYAPLTVPAVTEPEGGWPTKVLGFAELLADLLRSAGHGDIESVDVRQKSGATNTVTLAVTFVDGSEKFGLFARVLGPGAKRSGQPDYHIPKEMM